MFRQAVWFSGVVVLISLMQTAGGIGAGTTLYLADSGHVELLARNKFFIHMWLIGSAVADVLIASSMTYLLMSSAEPGTHHIIKRVVRLIVETNSLTGVLSFFSNTWATRVRSLSLQLFPHLTGYFLPRRTMILPEIYANTLLLVLNNRAAPNRTAPQRAPARPPTRPRRASDAACTATAHRKTCP
ncbi:hypothetical protein C8J57DRAFT_1275152, partial [Mycena rebaudengoi]